MYVRCLNIYIYICWWKKRVSIGGGINPVKVFLIRWKYLLLAARARKITSGSPPTTAGGKALPNPTICKSLHNGRFREGA
jgi:hypothetical protein